MCFWSLTDAWWTGPRAVHVKSELLMHISLLLEAVEILVHRCLLFHEIADTKAWIEKNEQRKRDKQHQLLSRQPGPVDRRGMWHIEHAETEPVLWIRHKQQSCYFKSTRSVVSLKGCEAARSQPSLLASQRNVTNGDKPFFTSPLWGLNCPHLDFLSAS